VPPLNSYVQAKALIQLNLFVKGWIDIGKRRLRLEPSTVRRVRHPSRHGDNWLIDEWLAIFASFQNPSD
jgi:hypothetical protein